MKGKTPFAIILFFQAGFTPKEIIEKGYSASTVYKYHGIFKEALKEYRSKK